MSSVKPLDPPQDISQEIAFPPGDLFSNEPPLESELHLRQILLLLQSLEWFWNARQDFYACGNLTIYYSPNQRKSEQFRGPDFFVVLGVERKPRKSWVVWQEDGKYPNLIIEILSSSTTKTDRGLKKQIYQDIFRTPDYFWFDPDSLEFQGFHLVDGEYQDLQPNANGQLWSQQLQLYLGVHNSKLRWFDGENQLLFMPEEVARQEQQQREQAEQQLAETETLLARYRERFGELPEQ
ncbi:Uma2 family endonuclease [Lusitaniella coriacea]|uniref:Uma2 family endonuclease n=1 Tax=Lusitaniella coriacea TaxID=1983105 RepID=UPI003CF00629